MWLPMVLPWCTVHVGLCRVFVAVKSACYPVCTPRTPRGAVSPSVRLCRVLWSAGMFVAHPSLCMPCPFPVAPAPRQNVPAEKLFSQERGVRQLLHILAGATTADSGRFVAWDGQDVPW